MIYKLIEYITIWKSGLFDSYYYLREYPDIRIADLNPLMHYITYGWEEGRNPSTKFDTTFYLESYPDVDLAGINPLIHYLKFGRKEGRKPLPKQSLKKVGKKTINKKFNRKTGIIYNILQKIYYSIPLKFRKTIRNFSFSRLSFIFKGLQNYKNWQYSQEESHINFLYQENLLNISEVEPITKLVGSIAIHIHIFYDDLAHEFVKYLENMPFYYDLYVSVSNNENLDKYKNIFVELPFCIKVEIRRVANRGRDIAPLFCAFKEELITHDYIAHLHTKKSIFNQGATEGWREYLCNNLVGSSKRIRQIFNLMQEEDPCGIVYPQNYSLLPYWANTWLSNKNLGQDWCLRLGIVDFPKGYFDYPASSMFWARSDALAPLFNTNIKLEDFPEEMGQTDGTLAHCLERLFALSSLKEGLRVGIIKDENQVSWSSWRFDQYTNRRYLDMVKLLNSSNIKLIAFDIFDTIFCRPLLDPETIKKIVARRLTNELGDLYLEYRAIAENRARIEKGSDVDLKDIYLYLGKLTGLTQNHLDEIRSLEEQIEELSLEIRPEIKDFFEEALSTNKPVVFISDMFLPKKIIERILI